MGRFDDSDTIKNCVDKKSGSSYEAMIADNGKVTVYTYEGGEVASFDTMEQAEKTYMFF